MDYKDKSKVELIQELEELQKKYKLLSSSSEEHSIKCKKDKEAFNETLLYSLPDSIYIYDIIDFKNVYSNEGISKILNYSTQEIQDMGDDVLSLLMHHNDFSNYQKIIFPHYQINR